MTSKEFVIAGLLNEGPSYGYEIEKKIEDRGVRNWTPIGFSSIYNILRKLLNAGFATQTSRIVKGKVQQVYELTAAGQQALIDQIKRAIRTVEFQYDDFSIAISNTIGMPSEDIHTLLGQRINKLESQMHYLQRLKEEKLISGTPDIPAVTILFDRPMAFLKADRDLMQLYYGKF